MLFITAHINRRTSRPGKLSNAAHNACPASTRKRRRYAYGTLWIQEGVTVCSKEALAKTLDGPLLCLSALQVPL